MSDRLGAYEIDRELGSGGMGRVVRATGPDGVVALKVVHPHLLEADGFLERFRREAEIGLAVRHPNVVRTLAYEELDGSHVLVMEYVEGQTLAGLRKELERVPEELCRHVAREVCKGLGAIHDVGVVHRDLKPENVLITPDHVVKVMDLGVAKLVDAQMQLSQTGAFIGSVEYAAPEQFKGGQTDHRTDLHALGLVLYELATGQHPFRGGSFHEVLQRVCEEDPRPLGEVDPQLSAFFEEVVHSLLVKDPRGRFASCAQLLAALESGESSTWWRERAREIQATTTRPIRRIRIPRETAVYGRDKELAKLTELYEQVKSGDGRVVLIEGEAGIGKSRLVDELIGRLQADGEDLNFLFGSYPPGGAASAAGAFSTAFREQLGEGGAGACLPNTPLLVPAFEALLRGDSTPIGAEPLTKDSLVTCFVQASRSLAADRPTVILIDDLHFAPEDARSLFSALAMAMPGHRVLLIGTTRPGIEEDWRANLQRFDYVTHMQVERLFPKDLAALLTDSFSSKELADSLGMQIAIKSDGNPFFAFEIIRGLREGQFITQRDDGTWASMGVIDEIQIPSSVLDLVNARVGDLTEEERDLLDLACCWGFEFDPVVVGDALGLGRIPALKRLGQIERQHRLVRSQGRTYAFDHHQVQEALYGALNEYLREEYHATLAEALETRTKAADKAPEQLDGALCVDLCEHYLKGARGEEALRYLDAAQTHLTKGYLHAQVVALTERALAIPDLLTGTERAETLLRLAAALETRGRKLAQRCAIDEAVELADAAGDTELRARAHRLLGHYLELALENEAATAELEHARALAREAGSREIEGAATNCLSAVLWSEGRLEEAEQTSRRLIDLFREIGDRAMEAAATGNLGVALQSLGRLREAQEHHERSLALNREIGDRGGEAAAMGGLGTVFMSLGRLREAQEHYERDLSLTREIGNRRGEADVTGNLGSVLFALGRLREAQEHYERHYSLSREVGRRVGEVIALHNWGSLLNELGESSASEEKYGLCLGLSREIGFRHVEADTHLALGSLRAGAGDEEGGRESLAAARSLAADVGIPGTETLARCELALLPGGDAEDALAAFTEHEERLGAEDRLSARFLLWKATDDRAHLEEAKRLLDESLANVPEEYHEGMLTNLRVNREIMTAWGAEFGDEDDAGDDDEPPGTESVTRVG